MLYRRKILLALLQALGGKSDSLRYQKLLFLFSQRPQTKSFEFIPYQRGCYSFQANSEMKVLERQSYISEEKDTWHLTNTDSWIDQLTGEDQKSINDTVSSYGAWDNDQLIHWTYTQYPYYAIHSEIIEKHLTEAERIFVDAARPKANNCALYTVGYEGLTLEGYLNRLIRLDVKVLCDVRRNPVSMKYGFARKTLERACKGVDIEYIHFPELGIDGQMRKKLNTRQDYEDLFKYYREQNLPVTLDKQREILVLLRSCKRVALTCFEADPAFCHRSHLANSIETIADNKLIVQHI